MSVSQILIGVGIGMHITSLFIYLCDLWVRDIGLYDKETMRSRRTMAITMVLGLALICAGGCMYVYGGGA